MHRMIWPILLCVALFGCETTPDPQQPVQTAAPSVDIEAKFATVNQKLDQVQNTVSNVQNNFGLDKERAKLESGKVKQEGIMGACEALAWIGLCLIFLLIPAPTIPVQWKAVLWIIAVCMLCFRALPAVLMSIGV